MLSYPDDRIIFPQLWFHEPFPQLWEIEYESYSALGVYRSFKYI